MQIFVSPDLLHSLEDPESLVFNEVACSFEIYKILPLKAQIKF